jgi:hypothetical protein
MKLSKPSPAMVVACVALFVALSGTAWAAVTYATNAGAVDGKSAVASSSTLARAAGNVVATNRTGTDRGKIPSKFLAGVARATTFGAAQDVQDNAAGAATTLGTAPGIGTLTASCSDQAGVAGREDPITTISLTNSSGVPINLAKRVGGRDAEVVAQAPNTVQAINIGGSNTFELHAQLRNVDLVVNGVVRQDGRGSAAASCVFYGTFTLVG